MKILIAITIILLIPLLLIISNNHLQMYKSENIKNFFTLTINWLDSIYSNAQKITGEAVRLEWLP